MANIITFKQIKSILGRVGNQSHKTHLLWMKTFRDRVTDNVITPMGDSCPALISDAFSSFDTAVTHEDQTAIIIQKSQHTEEIEKADDVRDNTWLGIKTMAEALLRVGTDVQKAAAKRFLDSASAHKIGISQKYEIETESIRQFIQQCEGTLAADVATLGLTSLIAQLKQENETVHTLIQQRNTEAAGVDPTAMQTAREQTDAAYKQLVILINAFAITTWANGQSPYDTCIDLVNSDIDYYERHVFSKKKKSDDDGSDDQGGGGSDDQGGGGSDDQGGGDDPQPGPQPDPTPKYALTIRKDGEGTLTVTDAEGQPIETGAEIAEGATLTITATPEPSCNVSASLNGSRLTLSYASGTYSGTVQMPAAASTLRVKTDDFDI